MCLTLRGRSKEPYNHPGSCSNIRYKIVERDRHGHLVGPFSGHRYKRTDWNVANIGNWKYASYTLENFMRKHYGYHVFVSYKDAVLGLRRVHPNALIAKVEVDRFGFNRSGSWRNLRSETWERFRIIQIYK